MAVQEIKDTQSAPLPKLENIYFLSIAVNSAKDLEKADLMGSSDPFCKVTANKQSWRTKTIMKNLNPVWNESTSFVFFTAVEKITFEVYDYDKGSKEDLIGTCDLEVKTFYDQNKEGFKGTLKLQKCKTGSIDVAVTGRLVKPLELEEKCDRLDEQVKKQSEEISAKNKEVEELKTQNANYTEEKKKLLGEQGKLNAQLDNLRQQIDAKKKENEQKQKEVEQLETKKQQIQEKINNKKQEINSKRESVEDEKRKLAEQEQQYKSLQEEVANRREELNQGYGYTVHDESKPSESSNQNDLQQPLL